MVESAQAKKRKLDAMVVQQGTYQGLTKRTRVSDKEEIMAAVRFGANTAIIRSEKLTITDKDVGIIFERNQRKRPKKLNNLIQKGG